MRQIPTAPQLDFRIGKHWFSIDCNEYDTLENTPSTAVSRFKLQNSWLSTRRCVERVDLGSSWPNNRNSRPDVLLKSAQLSFLGLECLALLLPHRKLGPPAKDLALLGAKESPQSAWHFEILETMGNDTAGMAGMARQIIL